MNNRENHQIEIGNKLDNLDNKINFLQDSLLKIQNEFTIMRKSEIKENYCSQLSLTANKDKLDFLEKRASKCEIAEACLVTLEKSIYEILCTFNEKGAKKSLSLIDRYLRRMGKMDKEMMNCIDGACLRNYINTFKNLRELINDSREIASRHAEELIALNKNSIFDENVEDEIYNLLTPLSNEIRLKIMNNLRKGGKAYSQLENCTGIKAGHLRFHLEKLINGGYVTKSKKNYILTINGLKVLKFLYELRAELILTQSKNPK